MGEQSERRSTKGKKKFMHPSSRGKDVPSPSHISNTLKANLSLDKILGEDITSSMKDVVEGGGKKGCNSHG